MSNVYSILRRQTTVAIDLLAALATQPCTEKTINAITALRKVVGEAEDCLEGYKLGRGVKYLLNNQGDTE